MNALSNIANPYIQSLTNAATSALNSFAGTAGTSGVSPTAIPQDGSPQLSPFAQLLNTLQQLQQKNPSQYQSVTQQIAQNLQSASQTAQANGNTSAAQELSTLANDFQNSSANNQLPNISDLAQSMGGGHHHHHHHASSSSSANSGTSNSQSQLISAYSASSAQSDALNPMNIIMNTLSNAGITLGN